MVAILTAVFHHAGPAIALLNGKPQIAKRGGGISG
jgi:hypothetical protein